VDRFAINKKGIFRLIAVVLLAVCAGFTFPESHYSDEKTFVNAPSPQTEICTLLCDDVEDSNDYSTGAHFFQSAIFAQTTFSLLDSSSKNSIQQVYRQTYACVYLLHRQLLI
jgi:hypothetical protein